MISGNIPQQITILTRKPITVEGVEVMPAFVSDASNNKTLETGRSWAKESYYNSSGKGKEYVGRENKGGEGYRILDLVVRSEGGRAYKVVSPEGFYVDLREDVLLDTIQEVGISPGGVLNGSYLFATVGSQMKLIREGSALHKELIGATARRNSKKISSKDLEVGGVYATVGGSQFVFGGLVDTVEIKSKYNSGYNRGRYSSGYTFSPPKPLKNAQLWLGTTNFEEGMTTYEEAYGRKYDATYQYLYFSVDVIKDKKVLEKVGQLTSPTDYIQFVKDKTAVKLAEKDHDKIYSKIFNMVPAKPKKK